MQDSPIPSTPICSSRLTSPSSALRRLERGMSSSGRQDDSQATEGDGRLDDRQKDKRYRHDEDAKGGR